MSKNQPQTIGYPTCQHNLGVVCEQEGRNCENCGWDPRVEMDRKNRIAENNRAMMPKKTRIKT